MGWCGGRIVEFVITSTVAAIVTLSTPGPSHSMLERIYLESWGWSIKQAAAEIVSGYWLGSYDYFLIQLTVSDGAVEIAQILMPREQVRKREVWER
jgi:hypothetical protein